MIKRNMWTESQIKLLAELWDTKTVKQIALELELEVSQVVAMSKEIRKAGFDLPKKRSAIGHRREMIFNCLKDSGLNYTPKE